MLPSEVDGGSERWRDAGVVSDHVRAVWRVHLNGRAGTISWSVHRAVAGDYHLRYTNLDDLVVELIADQRVAVRESHRARR